MSEYTWVTISLAIILISIGIYTVFRGNNRDASKTTIKLLGQELEIPTVGLVIFLAGIFLFSLPFDIGNKSQVNPDQVDSGYTRTIIFSQDAPEGYNSLIFYARDNQEVLLTLNISNNKPEAVKIRINIDKIPYKISGQELIEGNFSRSETPITDKLVKDSWIHPTIHTIEFFPQPPAMVTQQNARIVIECIVLVKNKTK